MITKEQAKQLVLEAINSGPPDSDELVILDEHTIEKPWGWVFFYNSKKFCHTGDHNFALLGNGPFIVERETGKLIGTGSAYPIEEYIANYEKYGDPYGP